MKTDTQTEGEKDTCICHAWADNPKAPRDPKCPFHFPSPATEGEKPCAYTTHKMGDGHICTEKPFQGLTSPAVACPQEVIIQSVN